MNLNTKTSQVNLEPPILTGQQLADLGAWLVETGRGHLPVLLDRRGIGYLNPSQHERIGLGASPVEEMFAIDATYLRAVF